MKIEGAFVDRQTELKRIQNAILGLLNRSHRSNDIRLYKGYHEGIPLVTLMHRYNRTVSEINETVERIDETIRILITDEGLKTLFQQTASQLASQFDAHDSESHTHLLSEIVEFEEYSFDGIIGSHVIRQVELRDLPILELQLSTRAFNILSAKKVRTLGELCQRSRYELRMLRGMGPACLDEIEQVLVRYGLHLRES